MSPALYNLIFWVALVYTTCSAVALAQVIYVDPRTKLGLQVLALTAAAMIVASRLRVFGG